MDWEDDLKKCVLCICAPPKGWDGKQVVVSSVAEFGHTKKTIEPVGKEFQRRFFGYIDPAELVELDDVMGKSPFRGEDAIDLEEVGYDVEASDMYGLLGIRKLGVMATDEEIKRAYKTLSLKYHPDKCVGEIEIAETRYKNMQAAFETLSHPVKRRIYDSTLPFDDKVPSKNEGKADAFFDVFRPVFERNAQFSVHKPVPELGHADTPYEVVDEFYTFWLSFKSWREFKHEDEEKEDEADSREEKRWVRRNNERLRAKKKKVEVSRLRRFVEDAFEKDPRVIAQKLALKQAKMAKKNAKRDARMARQREADALEAEAKAAEEEKKLEAKAKAKAEKRAREKLRKQRKRIRKEIESILGVAREADDSLASDADVQEMANGIPDTQVEAELKEISELVASGTEGLAEQLSARVAEVVSGLEHVQEARRREQQELEAERKLQARLEADRRLAEEQREWTDAEMQALTKAIIRFPAGAGNRWTQIAREVNTVGGGNRTEKHVIKFARDREAQRATKMSANSNAFKAYLKSQGKNDGAAEASSPKTPERPSMAMEEGPASPKTPLTWSEKKRLREEAAEKKAAVVAPPKEAETTAAASAAVSASGKKKARSRRRRGAKDVKSATEENEGAGNNKPAAVAQDDVEKPKRKRKPRKKRGAAAREKEVVEAEAERQKAEREAVAKKRAEEVAARDAALKQQQEEAAEREFPSLGAAMVNEWTTQQQANLEKALRTVPKGPQRWDQIAVAVGGKTKKDCVRRFKEIRARIMAKKQSQAAGR